MAQVSSGDEFPFSLCNSQSLQSPYCYGSPSLTPSPPATGTGGGKSLSWLCRWVSHCPGSQLKPTGSLGWLWVSPLDFIPGSTRPAQIPKAWESKPHFQALKLSSSNPSHGQVWALDFKDLGCCLQSAGSLGKAFLCRSVPASTRAPSPPCWQHPFTLLWWHWAPTHPGLHR